MNDTLTTYKALTLQTVGGNNNTWGTILNSSLTLIDNALGGTLTKSITTDTTLNSTEGENTGFIFTGTLSANATITFPAFYGFATIYNNTTGGFDLSCGISGLTAVIPNGNITTIWSDGTDFRGLTSLFTGYTSTITGDPTGATNNTTGFNTQVSPGNSSTNAGLIVVPRGNWQFSGTVTSDDLTTWMLMPGAELGFYDSKTGNTHTTTTVDGLASNVNTAGWAVGMLIRSSNNEIPAGTTITAIDPGGLSLTLSDAATATNTGSTISVVGGTMTASPNLQPMQFSPKQVGVGFMRSMGLAGTTTGGTDGRGAGTANQSTLLIQAVAPISTSVTSYRKRGIFLQYDQNDHSPQSANGTNASPTRDAIGFWATVTSNITPGRNGYGNTVHGRIFPILGRGSIVTNGSAFTQVITAELNNSSGFSVQKFPYQNGGPNFTLRTGSAIAAGGTGYAVNDVLTLVGGTSTTTAQIKVDTVDGGGIVLTFHVQTAGSYSSLPSNPVSVTGGAGTGFTLTAAWQGQQASNHGVVVKNIGDTTGTSAIAVLADSATFWDGIMIDAAAVQNNVFAVIDTPGTSQNVLASIDNTGFVRATSLICTITSNSNPSKIRSKNQGTNGATFLADVPSRTWQFGADQTNDVFKIASSESAAWTNTILSLDSVGAIVMPGSGTFTANGTTAIALSNIAPAAASPTVQKWFTVSDGTRKYYIPAF